MICKLLGKKWNNFCLFELAGYFDFQDFCRSRHDFKARPTKSGLILKSAIGLFFLLCCRIACCFPLVFLARTVPFHRFQDNKMAPTKSVPKARKGTKILRKKKVHLKFNVECKNPVEDGIMKLDDFVCFFFSNRSFPQFKVELTSGIGWIYLASPVVFFRRPTSKNMSRSMERLANSTLTMSRLRAPRLRFQSSPRFLFPRGTLFSSSLNNL